MKQVAVQFPSVVELIDFVHETEASISEVNEENVTFTGDLTEADLNLALNDYHATLVG